MSYNPEQYGYHDETRAARIAKKVRRAMKQQSCHGGADHFHEDDCTGCDRFIKCFRKTDGFDCECYCPYCYWTGYWDDCDVKVIPMTHYDPEERYSLCPLCGQNVESVED